MGQDAAWAGPRMRQGGYRPSRRLAAGMAAAAAFSGLMPGTAIASAAAGPAARHPAARRPAASELAASAPLLSVPALAGPASRLRIATPFRGTPAVGALFRQSGGHLRGHFCTASVVHSPAHDLLITAAHCMAGWTPQPAGQVQFAPGYHRGKFPFGRWPITAVYVNSQWSVHQDPNDDFAFLVAGLPGTQIEKQTGAELLKANLPPPLHVRVIGYPDGTGRPVRCPGNARSFGKRQLVFVCGGYTDGTSGGPFLTHISARSGDGWVVGDIGGYELGGDTPSVSYSPRYLARIEALYKTVTAPPPGQRR